MKFTHTTALFAFAAFAACAVFTGTVSAQTATPALTFEGSNYYLTSAVMSWDAAEAEAVAMGGHLADINSAAESAALGTVSAFNSRTTFIGLSDAAVEGQFVWSSGAALTYTNWIGGEPNGGVIENLVERRANGTWNDVGSGSRAYGIIEVSAVPEPATLALLLGGLAAVASVARRRAN